MPRRLLRHRYSIVGVITPWLPALSLLMGAVILAGRDRRFSTPSLKVPRELAPWWVWSLVFCCVGVFQMVPMPLRFDWIVRFLAAIPFAVFAVSIGFSAHENITVAFTGPAVYGWVTIVHLRLAAARYVEAKTVSRKGL